MRNMAGESYSHTTQLELYGLGAVKSQPLNRKVSQSMFPLLVPR